MLLALSREKPGLLLEIPYCTGQLPTTGNYLAPDISGAEVE